jgi:hypothetical protein
MLQGHMTLKVEAVPQPSLRLVHCSAACACSSSGSFARFRHKPVV